MNQELEKKRFFLKDHIRLQTDFSQTDQSLGKEPPPVQKEIPAEAETIKLIEPQHCKHAAEIKVMEAVHKRQSRRKYTSAPLQMEELSFLLWATQGVRKKMGQSVLRNVPSAGNRHPFETYICILNVAGISCGIYRYLPLQHQLLHEESFAKKDLAQKISMAALGQFFVGLSCAVFVWTALPYRTEWRYGLASHKVIAIDAGHVCQNLYIACEAVGAGTCAIAAYHQNLMDDLIGVDGNEEFVVYLAPVGKIE